MSVSDPDLVVVREAGSWHGEGALYLVVEEPLCRVGRHHLVAGHLGAGAQEHRRPGLARTLHLPQAEVSIMAGCQVSTRAANGTSRNLTVPKDWFGYKRSL